MSFSRTLLKLSLYQDNDPLISAYGNDGLPDATVTSIGSALDYIVASMFPNAKPSVATELLLPVAGNSVNDYRIVLDFNSTGQASGYRWTQLEGQATPQWNQVQIFNSQTSILEQWELDASALFVNENGMPGGQTIHGSTDANEDLTLSANSGDGSNVPANQTGYINFFGDARPLDNNAYDLGTATEQFASLYLAGLISDGTASVTVANMLTAYQHSQLVTGNPHQVAYEEVINRLGNVTIDGDVGTLVVDFSTQGNKTFTLAITDDSHNHTVSTITDFEAAVWARTKVALVDSTDVTWTFDEGLKTATADVTIDTSSITDISSPVVNSILASNSGANLWRTTALPTFITGDVSGNGSYNSALNKISIPVIVDNVAIQNIDRINIANLAVSASIANPTVITQASHGMQTSRKVRLFGTTFDNEYVITVLDANTYSIVFDNSGGAVEAGYVIPNSSQFLYDSLTDEWLVRLENSQLSHYELSDLGLDDHAQYHNINGRTDGSNNQLTGGEIANGNLYLESTSHATKGDIRCKDNVTPETGASYAGSWSGTDIGATARRFRDIYLSGVISNLRVETVGSTPVASAQEKGRLTLLNGGDLFFNKDGVNNRLILDETNKGIANGTCPLDGSSKVAAIYLPSYVDDVLEFANLAAFPGTGETGKIYVAIDTGKTYRWSGSAYVEISPSDVNSVNGNIGVVVLDTLDISENTNLYFTDTRAKTAAVLNTLAGSETDQAPSVAAVNAAIASATPLYEQEVPSGSINGVNTAYGLSVAPSENKAVQLYLNGLIQRQGIDYTVLGQNITMTVAPEFGQDIYAFYTKG